MRVSIILPAKNEADGLRQTLPGLRAILPQAEVIVKLPKWADGRTAGGSGKHD